MINFNMWNKLSLKVIVLFVITMIISFSPEFLRGFFDDKLYSPDTLRFRHDMMDSEYDWGWRHYLYLLMCICLFVIQAIKIAKWIDKNWDNFTVKKEN